MKKLILFVSFIFCAGSMQAQEISIHSSAKVNVPADKVVFNIQLNAESETPQKAYKLHHKREKVLVDQLKKHDIKEKDIHFEPISIHRIYPNRNSKADQKRVKTNQKVSVTFDDFDLYEQIQLTLIQHNFDEFDGNFTSTKSKKAKDQALQKALKQSREKAGIIAKQSDLIITGIKTINYSHNQGSPRPVQMQMRAKSSDSLFQFDQTLSISANISVTYEAQKNK